MEVWCKIAREDYSFNTLTFKKGTIFPSDSGFFQFFLFKQIHPLYIKAHETLTSAEQLLVENIDNVCMLSQSRFFIVSFSKPSNCISLIFTALYTVHKTSSISRLIQDNLTLIEFKFKLIFNGYFGSLNFDDITSHSLRI